ncbi:hypothetical protein BDY24DRAFT_379812 [Mrakia frigida]|uniref:uncharacterized protein n=1 Tax=Mrakia frigida TaxID=29902 RepID=UPI003FCC2579
MAVGAPTASTQAKVTTLNARSRSQPPRASTTKKTTTSSSPPSFLPPSSLPSLPPPSLQPPPITKPGVINGSDLHLNSSHLNGTMVASGSTENGGTASMTFREAPAAPKAAVPSPPRTVPGSDPGGNPKEKPAKTKTSSTLNAAAVLKLQQTIRVQAAQIERLEMEVATLTELASLATTGRSREAADLEKLRAEERRLESQKAERERRELEEKLELERKAKEASDKLAQEAKYRAEAATLEMEIMRERQKVTQVASPTELADREGRVNNIVVFNLVSTPTSTPEELITIYTEKLPNAPIPIKAVRRSHNPTSPLIIYTFANSFSKHKALEVNKSNPDPAARLFCRYDETPSQYAHRRRLFAKRKEIIEGGGQARVHGDEVVETHQDGTEERHRLP